VKIEWLNIRVGAGGVAHRLPRDSQIFFQITVKPASTFAHIHAPRWWFHTFRLQNSRSLEYISKWSPFLYVIDMGFQEIGLLHRFWMGQHIIEYSEENRAGSEWPAMSREDEKALSLFLYENGDMAL